MKSLILWLKANPVAVLDVVKAVAAVLTAAGVVISGPAVTAIGVLVIAILGVVTQSVVSDKITEALNTPVPDDTAGLATTTPDATEAVSVDSAPLND